MRLLDDNLTNKKKMTCIILKLVTDPAGKGSSTVAEDPGTLGSTSATGPAAAVLPLTTPLGNATALVLGAAVDSASAA